VVKLARCDRDHSGGRSALRAIRTGECPAWAIHPQVASTPPDALTSTHQAIAATPEEEIKHLESVLTIVGGTIVHANAEFSKLAPPALPVSPDWSPVKEFGGYAKRPDQAPGASHSAACSHLEPSAIGRMRAHLKIRRGRQERWISGAAVRGREQRARVSEEWCTGMAGAEPPVVGTHQGGHRMKVAGFHAER